LSIIVNFIQYATNDAINYTDERIATQRRCHKKQ